MITRTSAFVAACLAVTAGCVTLLILHINAKQKRISDIIDNYSYRRAEAIRNYVEESEKYNLERKKQVDHAYAETMASYDKKSKMLDEIDGILESQRNLIKEWNFPTNPSDNKRPTQVK